MGKLGSCFAERLDETAPWPGLGQDRGVAAGETGITLVATEGPRVTVDGQAVNGDAIALVDDGRRHEVVVLRTG